MNGKLYLVPTPIAEGEEGLKHLPEYNRDILRGIDYFVVENVRTARRFISACKLGKVIGELTFVELSEHTPPEAVEAMLDPLLKGRDGAVLSEAGLPAVADPGAELVAAAHRRGIEVVPLVGPSSIFLALMASGMNGQSFAFHGYLPIKENEQAACVREMARHAASRRQSQIFIETPYRNEKLFARLLALLPPEIRLTVAAGIHTPDAYIHTYPVSEWKKRPLPPVHKVPAIFIIG